jgi:phosphopantothenoylcysteine decarboxylase/phosphopantothenate--cysteine ligase
MNDNMWNNPAVQRNVAALKEMGVRMTGPQKGRLACGTDGIGRMTEPDEIIKEIEKIAIE